MALTQTQLDALAAKTTEGKLALKIDAATPLLYCSGDDPVQLGIDWYMPRHVRGSFFALSEPSTARTRVTLDDRDQAVETVWYADRFSGYDVDVHILLREPPSKTWVVASSVTWVCEKASPAGGEIDIQLFAASGHRQRFGLTIGNTSLFPRAPHIGETFTFAGVTSSTTPPIAYTGAIPYAYLSLLDVYGTGPEPPPVEEPEPPPPRRPGGRVGG